MAQSTEVQLVIQAVDKATAALRTVSQGVEQVTKTTQEMNKTVAAGSKEASTGILSLNAAVELTVRGFQILKAAVEFPIKQFNALFDISADLVRKYDEQFLSELKLTTAAKASGNASSENVKQFKALAEQLEKTTRFQSEAIETGQGLALTSGATAAIMPKLTQAAADLATAAGTDVTEAFAKINQAVETGALRPGGAFGRLAFEFVRTGDRATDFARAVDLASSKAGAGIAQLAAQGGSGQIITAGHAFEVIEKSLGRIISQSPQFQGFLKTMTELFDELAKFIDEHGEEISNLFGSFFTASLDLAIKSLDVFIGGLKAAGTLIFGMLEALSHVPGLGIESPFADINKQIADLEQRKKDVSAGGSIFDVIFDSSKVQAEQREFDEINRQIDELKQKKKDLVSEPFKGTGLAESLDVFQTAAKRVRDEFEQNPLFTTSGLKGRLSKNVQESADAIKAAKDKTEEFGTAADHAGKTIRDVVLQLRELADHAEKNDLTFDRLAVDVEDFAGTGQTGIDFLTKRLQELADKGRITKEQFDALAASIRSAFSVATTSAPAFGGGGGGGASSGGGGGGGAPTGGGGGGGAIGGSIGQALDSAARAMAAAIVAAAAKLSSAAEQMVEPAHALEAASLDMRFQIDAMAEAVSGLSDASDHIAQSAVVVAVAGSELAESSKSAANDLITAASDLVTASGVLDKTFRQGNFPRVGYGGIPTRETLATIGDRPEVIIPLDERGLRFARQLLGDAAGGGGASIQVEINVERLDFSETSINELGRRIERNLADRLLESTRRR